MRADFFSPRAQRVAETREDATVASRRQRIVFFSVGTLAASTRAPPGRARALSPPPHRGRARYGFPLMSVEWDQLFGFSVPPLELVVRGTAMFFFLWLLFRVVIKRRIGAIGMADLLVLVIIADAAQNGMAGSYTSVSGAGEVGSTNGLRNYPFDRPPLRFPALQ